jgi:TrmH family RNA methyltransferase
LVDVITRITSLQNPHIKDVVRLANRRHRDEARQTVVEGVREVAQALRSGVVPVEAYLCPELLEVSQTAAEVATTGEAADLTRIVRQWTAGAQTSVYEVTPAVFAKMAYRSESGGILLVVPYRQTSLDKLPRTPNPFLVVVVEAEKPGNLGAILRTADAAGVDGLILPQGRIETGDLEIGRWSDWEISQSEHGTDIHNPNVIRASLGAYFTVPVAVAPAEEVIAWLGTQGIAIVATTPAVETLYTAVDMTGPVAIVMGSEAHGLSQAWLEAADALVRIPMFGKVDSLNLSAATALLLYEVVRQRTL